MPASARLLRIGAVIAATTILMSGCSASQPSDDAPPSPTPSATAAEAVVTQNGAPIAGTGTAMLPGLAFPIPDGDFRSVTLAVDCVGDATFQVGVDDPRGEGLTLQRGTCGDTATFEWPLTPATAGSLTVVIAEGVAWSVTPTFSTAAFVVDPLIAEDCAAYSTAYGLIYNADIGYTRYDDVDETEWNERIDTAAGSLADLADSSSSRLAESFAELVPILRDPQRVLGDAMSSIGAQNSAISESCSANQSPLRFDADYGA
jgi:hypothetical protein